MQTVFAIINASHGMEIVGSVTIEQKIDDVTITEYDKDEYGTYKSISTFPVLSTLICNGSVRAYYVVFPDRETAKLFIEATTEN